MMIDIGQHYGFGGGFTPFVRTALHAHTEGGLCTRYAARDVIYLMGQNDTCNEHLTPHCQSHGLDKSCSGALLPPVVTTFLNLSQWYLSSSLRPPISKQSSQPVKKELFCRARV